jgi:hypothetical protein
MNSPYLAMPSVPADRFSTWSEAEELTEDLLDEVVIRVRDPKRDAEAGEEGSVPPQPARTGHKAGSRPRNTTFDDKGIPATSSSVA